MKLDIHYTGHPFVDVGIATIVAHAQVNSPEELREEHLQAFEDFAKLHYQSRMMLGYLSYVIFPNLINGALLGEKLWDKYAEKRFQIIEGLFSLWRFKESSKFPDDETPAEKGEICIFTGNPAIIRIAQRLIPMIGGDGIINFFPEGRAKLPLSGQCILFMLAMPLGTLNSGGKTFMVHSHDPNILLPLTQSYFQSNLSDFAIVELDKRPSYKYPKTKLIDDLIKANLHVRKTSSLTAHLFVASSQNASIQLYYLPSVVLSFIAEASRKDPNAWERIVQRAWELDSVAKMKNDEQDEQPQDGVKIEYGKRNYFYEDLFDLPQNAIRFLRTYLMRYKARGKIYKNDPRANYSFVKEREVLSWIIIGIFLERIMNMEKTRLEAIKTLGERLAKYIEVVDDRFYGALYRAKNDYQIRLVLYKAANRAKSQKYETILPYDEFVAVFFYRDRDDIMEDNIKPDWYLARDLLMIRIIECLNPTWIDAHEQDLAELDTSDSETTSA